MYDLVVHGIRKILVHSPSANASNGKGFALEPSPLRYLPFPREKPTAVGIIVEQVPI